MAGRRRATQAIQHVGGKILSLLRKDDFVSLDAMTSATEWSVETAKRALHWLRARGAPIEFVQRHGYRLRDRTFSLPLSEPSQDDLLAALSAAGLLSQLGLTAPARRAMALFADLAETLGGPEGATIRPDALRVTQTGAPVSRADWLAKLLVAARSAVVRIDYVSTWKGETTTHILEPWLVWLHDGVLYVKGYSRTRRAPRTLRLANIRALLLQHGDRPTAPFRWVWGRESPPTRVSTKTVQGSQ